MNAEARRVRDGERAGAQAVEADAALDDGRPSRVRQKQGGVEGKTGGNRHRDLLWLEERFGLSACHVPF
ncbi:hypothetical protein D3C83_250450 [compost metagenome]